MPTLTPTKDTGGTAKASDVVYVEPERTVTDADLAKMIDIDGANAAFVADLLSACLAHERCGTHLYRSVAGRTNNAILKAKYEEFGDETLRHRSDERRVGNECVRTCNSRWPSNH